jgi:hypothetical protein
VDQPEVEARATEVLRRAGDRFAFVHGSRAAGTARPESDLDVAAWWGDDAPPPWEVDVPPHVDLLVLDNTSLELAGRVALRGRLLFDDDPPSRVRWQPRPGSSTSSNRASRSSHRSSGRGASVVLRRPTLTPWMAFSGA